MSKKERLSRVCPFWSPAEHSCKILKEGLFIPLKDHLEIYCRSDHHTVCRQFRLNEHSHQETGNVDKGEISSNRRKYPRIKTTHHVTLVRLSESGQVVCHHPSIASILDLSSGGMRLKTRDLLMHDSIIQFHFNSSFPSSLKSGLAKVKWCESTSKDMRYQAGLAFQNDHVVQAMGEYLESRV
jgi:hypothetical protein